MSRRPGTHIATFVATTALALGVVAGVTACKDSDSDTPTPPPPHGISKSEAPSAPKPPKDTEPAYTTSQRNAIGSAQDYLDLGGFSKAGLTDQLSSSYGDGYSKADAVFAVEHVEVDWNAEAVESANEYLSVDHYSRAGLIDQLTSSYGEGYTKAQGEYAADKVGLK